MENQRLYRLIPYKEMVSMAIVCVLKITNAPTTMVMIKLFGSTIQNGKTLLNVRSLWIANCRMTSAKFGDLIIMDNPVGESSTTMVLHSKFAEEYDAVA